MDKFGIGIFDNNNALDVHALFEQCMREGKSPQETEEFIIDKIGGSCMGTWRNNYLEWIAFANLEWCYGFLSENVREEAFHALKHEMHKCNRNILEDEFLDSRYKVLEKQLKLLLSPFPEIPEKGEEIYTLEYFNENLLKYSY